MDAVNCSFSLFALLKDFQVLALDILNVKFQGVNFSHAGVGNWFYSVNEQEKGTQFQMVLWS